MEAKELMLGDYILANGEKAKVTYLDNFGIVRYQILAEGKEKSGGKIEPAPLTREFLEKNGFRYNEDVAVWMHRSMFVNLSPSREGMCVMDDIAIGEDVMHFPSSHAIRNIHQLQHLYRICKLGYQNFIFI